ncbi:MAG: 1-acyl-sn-glycerol-3-phosphate acyltransferase [Bacteroidota bacterium]
MLIYKFNKNLAALSMLVQYRKLYFIDSEKLPSKDGATVFAVNHPTAFTDSFIFMVYSPFDCYFMLRGDFFRVSPFVRWFMDQIRLIPIFRQRDGISALKQNQELFEMFYQILHDKKDISIMVEGSHDHRKRLRKVQRGTARIVFGTYDKYGDEDIKIVPVGVTYSNVTQFRSTAAVRFGDPILLKDYLTLHHEKPRKAMLKMTKDIEDAMKPLLVHIEREEDDEIVNLLLDMSRNDRVESLFPPFSKNAQALEEEIALANQVNAMQSNEKADFAAKIQAYFKHLNTLNVKDLGLAQCKQIGFETLVFLLLGSPLFVLGYILAFVPLLIAKRVLSKVEKPEFIASMMLVSGMFGYLIYFIVMLIVAFVIGTWWSILGVFLMPFISYFAILYRDVFLKWRAVQQFKALDIEKKESLLKKRTSILGLFQTRAMNLSTP